MRKLDKGTPMPSFTEFISHHHPTTWDDAKAVSRVWREYILESEQMREISYLILLQEVVLLCHKEAFNGTTESLVRLYRESQISYEQLSKLSESEIKDIIEKPKDLPISKEHLYTIIDSF